MNLPAVGYGLRYDFGIFKQRIVNGYQMEQPDEWLKLGYPWEIAHPEFSFPVQFEGRVDTMPGIKRQKNGAGWIRKPSSACRMICRWWGTAATR